MDLSTLSYQKFVQFALEQTKLRTTLTPLPSQEKFKSLKANDNKSVLNAISFCAPKIRLLRSLTIEDSQSMLVLDFAAFSKPEYDAPIFCANAFTTPSRSIVVLDLNPLYDVTIHPDYKEKYYKKLMPLSEKYSELLPWGGKLTSESLKFFSPIVIWTTVASSQLVHDVLFSAFVDYFKAWLELIDEATDEKDESLVLLNREAQHKYLTWRAEKDPGYSILKKLFGETLAKDLVRQFLFDGVDSLGSKTFLDYFPEYRLENGTVNKKRSMVGKSYETRPWNSAGEFIAD
ncbi:Phycoerythrobilin:ferredoxin oxidoreductase [Rhynchospora pubera]|uniref:Phycoerythrobilin:ferredoxin oxidoreductase n=1 Tax=Rhynchospora pubera TaxID=906938 RepID=A0AAV8DX64_9POAL|nr:Phycoerythrobilin:ferredoxin oxidoreductase [Rhynchospora pubera]